MRVSVRILGFWFIVPPLDAFLTPALTSTVSSTKRCGCGIRNASSNENGSNSPNNSNTTTTTTIDSKTDPLAILPQLYTYQKPRQKRRPQITLTRPRKPRYYWHSPDNLREELYLFWEELDVPIRKIYRGDQSPPIPSEYLLNYFNRNDLRWGIAQMGGRENVSYLLGGAKIIPGRWKEAMKLEEVEYLLPRMEEYGKQDLQKSKTRKPTLRNGRRIGTQKQSRGDEQQGKENKSQTVFNSSQHDMSGSGNSTTNLTLVSLVSSSASINSTKRQRKEFWSKEKATKELYQYLESYRKYKQRPAVWMPLLAELSHEGYSKLFNACSRFEKLPCVSVFSSIQKEDEGIHSIAGLVPFREWRFFESQLQLFVELQHYLHLHHHGSEELFPEPSKVLKHGHKRLHELIRIHGGQILLAQKLDMKFAWDVNHLAAENTTGGNRLSSISNKGPYTNSDLCWGSFTLNFATQLLHFIRSQYLSLDPPLSSSIISMPSEKDLLCCGQDELARQVIKYGGYESVARRLGLAYFDRKSQHMEERTFRGAKMLWRDRHTIGVLSGTSTSLTKDNVNGRKRQGLAWDENLVIKELHAYVNLNMTKRSLPPTVMPQLNQLDEDGRGDLKRAISKFGGVKHICDKAGLIPIKTWLKFEPISVKDA